MRIFSARLVAAFASLSVAGSALAWDGAGHRVVGEIAMRTLQRMHSPAYAKIKAIIGMAHSGIPDLAQLATMPDQIKSAGLNHTTFPTDLEHRYNAFHYFDRPIPASQAFQDPNPTKNALVMLRDAQLKLMQIPDPKQKAWYLGWIAHLVGDIHQPLHASTHYFASLKTKDHFDAGGNDFFLEPIPSSEDPWVTQGARPERHAELHAYWDGLVAKEERQNGHARVAERLMNAVPTTTFSAAALRAPAATWLKESYDLAASKVYTSDLTLYHAPSTGYENTAHRIADRRIALAGYRLAIVLDRLLK